MPTLEAHFTPCSLHLSNWCHSQEDVDVCVFVFVSELSQDVASKGLGLVYELGGEQDQQELVSTLVETLMTGKR